ncbi:MAG: flagellar basal body protein [Bryobacteraceae bacterium]
MSLFSVLSVSASGMAAQRIRAEVTAENLANADTTRTPKRPYACDVGLNTVTAHLLQHSF